jgi:sensor histidine kinase YesM
MMATNRSNRIDFEIPSDRKARERELRKRVKEIRSFYLTLAAYCTVHIGFWIYSTIAGTPKWSYWITFGWGVGIAFWAFNLFARPSGRFFGAQWEENKVQELLARENIRAVSSEKRLVEAQLRLLQAQIEPHFLFNTLANVQSLISKQPAVASAMLERFIAYLRQSLNASRNEQGTLGQELDLLTHYLELLKIRMGDRLQFSIAAPEALRSIALAPMLLQPVVENAIKHGLESKVEGGRVDIAIQKINQGLLIEIRDNGLGFEAGNNANALSQNESGGVGLSNLRERLQLLYGNEARLNIQELKPGTLVSITIPI